MRQNKQTNKERHQLNRQVNPIRLIQTSVSSIKSFVTLVEAANLRALYTVTDMDLEKDTVEPTDHISKHFISKYLRKLCKQKQLNFISSLKLQIQMKISFASGS